MKSRDLALKAVFTALVFVATAILPIPIAATGGYFNFGEAAIYIAALLFGGYVGAFAGGVGSMLADLALGFGSFAPITLVVKGVEGYVVGRIGHNASHSAQILALGVGICILVAGYFVAEVAMFGLPAALSEAPVSVVQGTVGAIIAKVVVTTVGKRTKERG